MTYRMNTELHRVDALRDQSLRLSEAETTLEVVQDLLSARATQEAQDVISGVFAEWHRRDDQATEILQRLASKFSKKGE